MQSEARSAWSLRPGVTYLNHGSFGPSPRPVIEAREAWARRVEEQPMDFLVRRLEPVLDAADYALGRFFGAEGRDLAFVPNATAAMNLVAANVRLGPGDEVLLTSHEYGAVLRIWRAACQAAGATAVVRRLPDVLDGDDEIAETVLAGLTDRTRLIVVSHVTSPTAVILPLQAICDGARAKGVPVCVDGPHAPAMVDVDLAALRPDYYCASLHKWVSAPFGSGFLYVARRHQQGFRPVVTSWGGSLSGRAADWKDEFNWAGTYDPSPYLAVPDAIAFLEGYGLDRFRAETHALSRQARAAVAELTGLESFVADRPDRYGSMALCPLPPLAGFEGGHGRIDPLQQRLWDEYKIEVPVPHWAGRRLLRVSFHLYNTAEDLDRLVAALRRLL